MEEGQKPRLRVECRAYKDVVRDPDVGLSDEEWPEFVRVVKKKGRSINMKQLAAVLNPARAK